MSIAKKTHLPGLDINAKIIVNIKDKQSWP